MKETRRLEQTKKKEINLDVVTDEWEDIGYVTDHSRNDPKPYIEVRDGKIVNLDGKERSAFDSIDRFIADHGIDITVCEEAMAIDSLAFARMMVDISVPREKIVRYACGMTPAKLMDVVSRLSIVEIMMAQMKLRARKTIANQAHVTNLRDNPVLLAADAAEAALRGFAEIETTCVVGRNAPFNAIAILVGSQIGRPGVITQCSMEEALELQLGMQGLTSYAETISVYGTEGVFTDGDDTPWSKAFLASIYASRGIKMRSSSGSGAEVLMGDTEGKSMLYLEARCVWVTKAAGMQGTQNGAIDGIGISSSVPGGLKMIAEENLIASMLGLEVASGNDTWFSDSDMRRTAKMIPALFAGTDFVTSGYSATPNRDNVFAGSNGDSDDYDDYLMIQRDYLVDGGMVPAEQEKIIAVRRKAGKAMQAVFEELQFAPISDEEIECAVYAYDSGDMPLRNAADDIFCAEVVLSERITGIDIAEALLKNGFADAAYAILEMTRQKIAADYLQTSAIFDDDFRVISAVNDPNEYMGPGSSEMLSGEKKKKVIAHNVQIVDEIVKEAYSAERKIAIHEKGEAEAGQRVDEVVVGVSPSFGVSQMRTLSGVAHVDVLSEISAGLEEEGVIPRFVKCFESSDLGVIGKIAAGLSGSGIGIGIQAKGTTVIHQKDLSPLNNLELFPQAPKIDRKTYRRIGKNAARYAKSMKTTPVEACIDPEVRRYLVRSSILHHDDLGHRVSGKKPVEFVYEEERHE